MPTTPERTIELGPTPRIRRLALADSFAELTVLIRRAYKPLGDAGMNFTGVDQSEATTRERCGRGTTFVAVLGDGDGPLVATLTVAGPESSKEYGSFATPTSWHLEQFAVDPSLQGTGVGRALAKTAERHAAEHGATAILGDTSERATHLVALYRRAGYAVVGTIQWPGKTYRSVVLEKRVAAEPVALDVARLPRAEFLFPGPGRDRLVAAVLSGAKTAGTALHEEHVRCGEPVPSVGTRSAVVDSRDVPVAVIETTSVEVKRMRDVDLRFAIDEGEGFLTVAEWFDAHVRAFSSPAMRKVLGEPPVEIDGDTLVVCERFRVLDRFV